MTNDLLSRVPIPVWVNPQNYGLIADGASHALSTKYATLAAAQAVYPFATALTQEIDYCACKQASNVAFGADGVEHGTNSKLNKPLFLPAGEYVFGTSIWTIRNLNGAVIKGAGMNATKLRGAGAAVLQFDGIWMTSLEDFWISQDASNQTCALDIDGNVPGHAYTTRSVQFVTCKNMHLVGGGSLYACAVVRQGGNAAQGNSINFITCAFSGASFACYAQTGTNAIGNTFVGCDFQALSKHGIYALNGCFSVYDCTFETTTGATAYDQVANGGYDIYSESGGGTITVYGCRTENIQHIRCNAGAYIDVRACHQATNLIGWFANTSYGYGTTHGPAIKITSNGYTQVFVVVSATNGGPGPPPTWFGDTGGVQPVWPTNGTTVVDNQVTWQENPVYAVNITGTGQADADTRASCDLPVICAPPFVFNNQVANYIAVHNDTQRPVHMSVGIANTFTIPPVGNFPKVQWQLGDKLVMFQGGVGQTTITPGAGVFLLSAVGLKTRAQYSRAECQYIGSNTWFVYGDLTP